MSICDEFITATAGLISSSAEAWASKSSWADPDTKEPVWYENIRVLRWVGEPPSNDLVVEKFIQKVGVYLFPHSHPKSPVCLYLMSGSISLIIDGQVNVLQPGHSAFVPIGCEHAVFASKDSECVSIHREQGGLSIDEPFDDDKIIREVFTSIRNRFISAGSHGAGKLTDEEIDIFKQIGEYPYLVFGAIVAFEDGRPRLIKTHAVNLTSEKPASSPENYLTAILHKTGSDWSPNTVYVFSDDADKRYNAPQANWYKILPFSSLPSETQSHILSHFNANAKKRVCVYCPFIVPNNEALSNFVGFYENVEPHGDGNPFLKHVSSIQHAGTLMFARLAIENALHSKSKKIERPLKELSNLRSELDKVSSVIGEIESVMNPYYLLPAKREIELLRGEWAPLFEGDWHDIKGTSASWECRTTQERQDHLNLLVAKFKNHSKSIQDVLRDVDAGLYGSYFAFEGIDPQSFEASTGYIYQAKALVKKRVTLDWVKKSLKLGVEPNDVSTYFLPDNDITPFHFCLALRTLANKPTNKIEICPTPNLLTIKVTVLDDGHGAESLAKLAKSVFEKFKHDVISLSDGHDGTALALIIKAAREFSVLSTEDAIVFGDKPLVLSYSLELIP